MAGSQSYLQDPDSVAQDPPYPPQPAAGKAGNGMVTAGLWCEIIALVLYGFGGVSVAGAFGNGPSIYVDVLVLVAFCALGGLVSLLAVIFGAIGLSNARKGRSASKGMAFGVLVMGIVCLAAPVAGAFVGGVAWEEYSAGEDALCRAEALVTAGRIKDYLEESYAKNGGVTGMPQNVSDLVKQGYITSSADLDGVYYKGSYGGFRGDGYGWGADASRFNKYGRFIGEIWVGQGNCMEAPALDISYATSGAAPTVTEVCR